MTEQKSKRAAARKHRSFELSVSAHRPPRPPTDGPDAQIVNKLAATVRVD